MKLVGSGGPTSLLSSIPTPPTIFGPSLPLASSLLHIHLNKPCSWERK